MKIYALKEIKNYIKIYIISYNSLQEINTKLNEKIESQVRTLDYFVNQKAEKFYNNCTQTDEPWSQPILASAGRTTLHTTPTTPTSSKGGRRSSFKNIGIQTSSKEKRDCSTNTIGVLGNQLTTSTTSSATTSRAASKHVSGIRKPLTALSSKMPSSQSDSTISNTALSGVSITALSLKEDSYLAANIRSMRMDLAIKNKALQRLTRDLDDCKKTIKRLQKEREGK